jgi:hypothetical protein
MDLGFGLLRISIRPAMKDERMKSVLIVEHYSRRQLFAKAAMAASRVAS